MNRTFAATLLLAAGLAGTAQAATFDWDFVWDGAALTETSATPMAGTTLAAGDNFTLTISAAGNGFWTTPATSYGLPINPSYASGKAGGSTNADAVTTFYLDGVQVAQDVETGEGRCCAELGVNQWVFGSATSFDVIELSYDLNTIQEADNELSGSFWTATYSSIPYTAAPVAAVPLPASAALYGGLLLGAAGVARRMRRAV